MGLFDKLKSKASEHSDKVNQGLDKAGEVASKKTGGKFDDKIERGKDAAGGYLGTDKGDASGNEETGSGSSDESGNGRSA
ncbi:MAG: antitoxin [Nocardioidaceae bacterium]